MESSHRKAVGLFVLACVAIAVFMSVCAGPRRPRPEQAAVGEDLALRHFEQVHGTEVFRAVLGGPGSGYGSGSYGSRRNVLFIEPNGKSKWLLPDGNRDLEEFAVGPPDAQGYSSPSPAKAVVVVGLATPTQVQSAPGDLYLYEPTGRRIVQIAKGVLEVRGTALSGDQVVILYEDGKGYRLAHFEVATFTEVKSVPVAVPALPHGRPTMQ